MVRIPKQRAVFDRARTAELLREAVHSHADADAARAAILDILKHAIADGQAEVERRFRETQDGTAAATALSFLTDQLLRTLYDYVLESVVPIPNPTAGERLAIVAVGGYGRGEMAPYSDIDILFLTPHKLAPSIEQTVEYLLYMLWDLGLKVGHACRSVRESIARARDDVTIQTNLLEHRFVWGSQDLHREFAKAYRDEFSGTPEKFIEAKLAERDDRHKRMGDSRYVLEPNLKEGKGGLRDLQTLFWIARSLYGTSDPEALTERRVLRRAEAEQFRRAHAFLWTVRFHLHYMSGRGEERLTFDSQLNLAKAMGYVDRRGSKAVERFMKHYFIVAKTVGDLTRIFCAAMESEQKRRPRLLPSFAMLRRSIEGFPLEDGRLSIPSGEVLREDPVAMLRMFKVADQRGIDIHPRALRIVTRRLRLIDDAVRNDPEANRVFLDILTSRHDPETALRRMNEAGVFGRFIPDFARVVAQMQYDMYHVYTVDEHTIFAIGLLPRIEKGEMRDELPIASEVIHKVVSREVLYVSVLLHDIAKGRPGDHSVVGEQVARDLCPRFGMSAEDTETVAWLVRWHLLMSATAFKRDLDDPKTIRDFVDHVQSPENLRLLLVLTVADIRAVGPNTWTPWKATLLRQLYRAAMAMMSGGLDPAAVAERQIDDARQRFRETVADWSEDEVEAFVAGAGDSYWLFFDTARQERHARMLREAIAIDAPIAVDFRVDGANGVTEVTVIAPDRAGLLPRLAGGMAACGATIVDAKVFTLANGYALDTFTVQELGHLPFDRPDRRAKLAAALEQAVSGSLDVAEAIRRNQSMLPSRDVAFRVTPRVVIDNKASNTHTVIEVNGRDRPGFLWMVSNALSELDLRVSSAKIATYGERVVDVFYIKDAFGLKVIHERKLRQIRNHLLELLGRAPGVPAAAVEEASDGKGEHETAPANAAE